MKVLCDVCGANEAAVLCCADEAALCSACDRRVHRANKLAGKHPRLSLLSPSSHPRPLCDICKERPGFVFCKEDRAILCHECDSSIHTANGLTMKHGRFILTGARLSASVTASSEERTVKKETFSPIMADESSSSSSISEYLIKTLPGYRFEDFLFEESVNLAAGDVFNQNDALAPLADTDLDAGDIGAASAATWSFSVPAAAAIANSVKESSNKGASRARNFLASPAAALATSHCAEQCTAEEVFAVPQLPSVTGSIKRAFGPSDWNF